VFSNVGLDWRDHVESDQQLFRPTDIAWSQGDASLASKGLGWEAKTKMPHLAKLLVGDASSAKENAITGTK
jgi:GDPmannose 4,6-dehydratase